MKRLWIVPVGVVALLVPMAAQANGQNGFDGVVRSIESRYHVRATRIPFMGVVSAIARTATHDGVGGLRVAEFESFSTPVDGEELNRIVEEKLGAGWERMIRETSRREQALIYMHPEGKRMGLFVVDVDVDSHEIDVVQLSVDPRHLDDEIGRYQHHPAHSDDSGERSD